MESINPLEISKQICDSIIEITPNNKILPKFFDVEKNKLIIGANNGDEFGDYVQNMAYYSKLSGDKKYSEWACNQILIGEKEYFDKNGLFNFTGSFFTRALESDTLYGLLYMYELLNDKKILNILDNYINSIFKYMITKKNFLELGRVNYLGLNLPLSNEMYTANLIEVLSQLSTIEKRDTYLEKAEKLALPWLESPSFKKHSLFLRQNTNYLGFVLSHFADFANSFYFTRRYFGKNSSIINLCKSNTHMLFSLLELYNTTGKEKYLLAVIKTLNSIENIFSDGKFYYGFWDSKKNNLAHIDLAQNHSMIELYVSLFRSTGNSLFLDKVKKLLDSWLFVRDANGLIPRYPFQNEEYVRMINQKLSLGYHLDPNIDFTINLLTYSNLSGDMNYLKLANDMLHSIFKHFRYKSLFVEELNDKLRPITYRLQTKFLGLMLKPLLIYEEISRGKNIANDTLLNHIAQDR